MIPPRLLALVVLLACLTAAQLFGQSPPTKDRFGLFKSQVYSVSPEIELILDLSPEQISKLEPARQAFLEDPDIAATRETLRGDPENMDAKNAFYAAQKRADTTYRQVANETLTEFQKARIEEINAFVDAIWKELADIEHWGERTKKLQEVAPSRLATILRPDEKARLGLGNAAPTATP